MALRQILGESTGEVMREDALPCSRITSALAGAASVGGFLCAWPLCVIYYGLTSALNPPSLPSLSIFFCKFCSRLPQDFVRAPQGKEN
jgi:hypothetical protein